MTIIFHGFRFPCEVRVRSVPLTPCRRKKRQVEEPESPRGAPTTIVPQKSEQNSDTQVQSSQVCNDIIFYFYFRNMYKIIKSNCIHCRV